MAELRLDPFGNPRTFTSREAAKKQAERRDGRESGWPPGVSARAVVDNGDGTFSVLEKNRANIDLVKQRNASNPPPENVVAEPKDPAVSPAAAQADAGANVQAQATPAEGAGDLATAGNGAVKRYPNRQAAEAKAQSEEGWPRNAADRVVVDNGDGTFSVLEKNRANIDAVSRGAVANPPPENTDANPVGDEDPVAEEVDAGEFGDIQRDLSVQEAPEPVGNEEPVAEIYDEFGDTERDLSVQPQRSTEADPANFGGGRGTVIEEPGARAAAATAAQEEERQQQINNAALERLKAQSAAQQIRKQEGQGDWRVKLRLASPLNGGGGSNYLYNSPNPGILEPLRATDGVVFPYTPSIQILYAADYNQYHPTHSNYQHYFYKGSKVGEVILTATFSAQDTQEANYLLAVIHFMKSASKMFYGQDPQRGSPPPLLFLSGLGDYQFNEAPCVISQFNYVLPNDVDYIRANIQSQITPGQTLQTNLRNKNNGSALTAWSSSINRVLNTPGLTPGAENISSRISGQTANLSTDDATYVPTKLEMTITLLPVQNRLQVSEGFSLQQYANGSLIKGGFW